MSEALESPVNGQSLLTVVLHSNAIFLLGIGTFKCHYLKIFSLKLVNQINSFVWAFINLTSSLLGVF